MYVKLWLKPVSTSFVWDCQKKPPLKVCEPQRRPRKYDASAFTLFRLKASWKVLKVPLGILLNPLGSYKGAENAPELTVPLGMVAPVMSVVVAFKVLL